MSATDTFVASCYHGDPAYRARSDVDAIEPIGAPYGSKRGLRIRAKEGPGTVIPLNLLEDGEQLEKDLRQRLADQQGPSPHDE